MLAPQRESGLNGEQKLAIPTEELEMEDWERAKVWVDYISQTYSSWRSLIISVVVLTERYSHDGLDTFESQFNLLGPPNHYMYIV